MRSLLEGRDWDYVVGSIHFIGDEALDTDEFSIWTKTASPEPLDRLRRVEPDAQTMRALALAAARRADLGGNLDDASLRMHELFEAEPTDLACAVYLAGLEKYVSGGGDPTHVASVASFFVSRIDTAVD